MLTLMLLRVVRVNGMGHISRQEETLVDSLEVLILIESGKTSENSLGDFNTHVAVGTLSGL